VPKRCNKNFKYSLPEQQKLLCWSTIICRLNQIVIWMFVNYRIYKKFIAWCINVTFNDFVNFGSWCLVLGSKLIQPFTANRHYTFWVDVVCHIMWAFLLQSLNTALTDSGFISWFIKPHFVWFHLPYKCQYIERDLSLVHATIFISWIEQLVI